MESQKVEWYKEKAEKLDRDGFVIFENDEPFQFDNDEAYDAMRPHLNGVLMFTSVSYTQSGILLFDTGNGEIKREAFLHKGRQSEDQRKREEAETQLRASMEAKGYVKTVRGWHKAAS